MKKTITAAGMHASLVLATMENKDEGRAAWVKMCEHDGIEPDALVVIFSDDNPHKAEHDRLICEGQDLHRMRMAWAGKAVEGSVYRCSPS